MKTPILFLIAGLVASSAFAGSTYNCTTKNKEAQSAQETISLGGNPDGSQLTLSDQYMDPEAGSLNLNYNGSNGMLEYTGFQQGQDSHQVNILIDPLMARGASSGEMQLQAFDPSGGRPQTSTYSCSLK